MFLLDTDVFSALRRQDRNPDVTRWIGEQRITDLYLSVVTIGEIERGITRQRTRDPSFARDLSSWLDRVNRGTAIAFSRSTCPRPAGGGNSRVISGTPGQTC